ncbi:hypothetical protein H8356DRAFT_1433781 [Neocallimastix lanati (nom. inval.)]|nr:hypothetical protein H8356DRAFT_1433781 [Neocallimastix sp. JGI-2020a]
MQLYLKNQVQKPDCSNKLYNINNNNNGNSSSESPVPKIVGLAEFLTNAIPIISSSFELLFDRYCKISNLTKSVDVVLIRHNENTGFSSITTKGDSRPSSSINDESGESLVDTTLSILRIVDVEMIRHGFSPPGERSLAEFSNDTSFIDLLTYNHYLIIELNIYYRYQAWLSNEYNISCNFSGKFPLFMKLSPATKKIYYLLIKLPLTIMPLLKFTHFFLFDKGSGHQAKC